MVDRFASQRYSLKNKLGDRMIKQYYWTHATLAKYRDLSVASRSIICQSQNFAQRCPIIAKDYTFEPL